MPKPTIFIGSATEGKEVADNLQVLLRTDHDVQVWYQGSIKPGQSILESLVKEVSQYDFGIFVFTADDSVTSRGETSGAPRDNVVFELGLFTGSLGRDRTFVVVDADTRTRIPSDLAGIPPISFTRHHSGNLRASLGGTATEIRDAIRSVGPRRRFGLEEKLDDVKRTVLAAGETGPGEQTYFDKLSQIISTGNGAALTLLYVDIDELRSVTRLLFTKERQNPPRRPESEIRAEVIRVLNVAMTDAVYQLHPRGLKHDIFTLPDPDAVLAARKVTYEDGFSIAHRMQVAFGSESAPLWPKDAPAPSITILVCDLARFTLPLPDTARLHRVLRDRLKALKDQGGRGRVFGRDDIGTL
jgi:Predicted nucleotide-binding protein containing TIR-like domain